MIRCQEPQAVMAQTITRSADGVPQYDGTPELLPLYREECLQYLMTFKHKKRYLAAPRLVKELRGVAKTAVRGMTNRDPQWVAHPEGFTNCWTTSSLLCHALAWWRHPVL